VCTKLRQTRGAGFDCNPKWRADGGEFRDGEMAFPTGFEPVSPP
jgi:hypothetical protein